MTGYTVAYAISFKANLCICVIATHKYEPYLIGRFVLFLNFPVIMPLRKERRSVSQRCFGAKCVHELQSKSKISCEDVAEAGRKVPLSIEY